MGNLNMDMDMDMEYAAWIDISISIKTALAPNSGFDSSSQSWKDRWWWVEWERFWKVFSDWLDQI